MKQIYSILSLARNALNHHQGWEAAWRSPDPKPAYELVDLFPIFGRLGFLRQWGGIVDTCPDASPIIGKTPVENLALNCGGGTGGFKATAGSAYVYAHTIATGTPHPLAAPFSLDRCSTGYLIDEHGASGVAH